MGRDILLLFLPKVLYMKLTQIGFRTTDDLLALPLDEIAIKSSLSSSELKILSSRLNAAKDEINFDVNPFALLSANIDSKSAIENPIKGITPTYYISTMCKVLDDILCGGIQTGCLTEIYGTAGQGKTQLGMQLCVNAQLPFCSGGVEGKSVYIDTEGSFSIQRVSKMGQSLISHLSTLEQNISITVDDIVKSIFTCRVVNHDQQISAINALASLLKREPNIRLIVIDSISYLFRYEFDDLAKRARIISSLGRTLNSLAHRFNVSVVVINQATCKFFLGRTYSIPSLGESWLNMSAHRLHFESPLHSKSGQDRITLATLVKSSSFPLKGPVPFIITNDGIRDYEGEASQIIIEHLSQSQSQSQQQSQSFLSSPNRMALFDHSFDPDASFHNSNIQTNILSDSFDNIIDISLKKQNKRIREMNTLDVVPPDPSLTMKRAKTFNYVEQTDMTPDSNYHNELLDESYHNSLNEVGSSEMIFESKAFEENKEENKEGNEILLFTESFLDE